MIRKLSVLIPLICLLAVPMAFGQINYKAGGDKKGEQKKKRVPITGGERFDFVFGRGLLVPGLFETSSQEGATEFDAPYTPSWSGSYYVGVGFTFPIGKVFGIKIEPRVNFEKLIFKVNSDKYFPSTSDSTILAEKLRFAYAELPVAFKFNLARNKKEKVVLFMEVGGSFGYNIGRTYKQRFTTQVPSSTSATGLKEVKVTQKVHSFENVNPFRYGPYFRIGARYVALDVYYRFSELFQKNATYRHPQSGVDVKYPVFSPLEVGLVVLF